MPVPIIGRTQKAVAVWIGDGFELIQARPLGFAEVYVIHWAEVGIIIPWPEGLTAKEAVDLWKQGIADGARPALPPTASDAL